MILKRFGDARKVRQYLAARCRDIWYKSVCAEYSLLPCLCVRSPENSLDLKNLKNPEKPVKAGKIVRWHAFPNIRKNFWLSSEMKLPKKKSRDGAFHVLLQCGSAAESLLYVNGRKISGIGNGMWGDIIPIRLPDDLGPGSRIRVRVNLFTGSTWDPGQNQSPQILQNFCVQEISQKGMDLYYAFDVALEAARSIGKYSQSDPHSFDILESLFQAWLMIDFSSRTAFLDSVDKPLACLRERVFGRGPFLPVDCTVFGHAHIDTAWLWPLSVTRQKCVRTFSTQVRLLNDYPGWVFQQGQAQLYSFLREDSPEIYSAVKNFVKKGRWEPSGGCWVEFDTNVSGGESIVRQILYGKEFFRDEFGRDNTVLWLPDTFGYSGALPQILKKSGIRLFMTTKLSWNDTTRHPCDTFRWKGIDGTELLTHFVTTPSSWSPDGDSPGIHTYNTLATPSDVYTTWVDYQQKDVNRELAMPFGFGDGGGGPHEDMVNRMIWMNKGLAGFPRVRFGGLEAFRERLERSVRGKDLPVYDDEMYLQFHRGVQTTQAEIKKNNRKAEFLLRFLDIFVLFSSSAARLAGINKKLWKTVLLNQFHDILPGSSIAPVYAESREQFAGLFREADKVISSVSKEIFGPRKKTGKNGRALTVFNPYSWNFSGYVEDPATSRKVFVDGVPPLGFREFSPGPAVRPKTRKNPGKAVGMSNRFFSFEVDTRTGGIGNFVLKANGRRMDGDGLLNTIEAYEDVGSAWDIMYMHRYKVLERHGRVLSAVLVEEEDRAKLILKKKILGSFIDQTISVYDRDPVVHFDTIVDWRESQCLLKAVFPVAVRSRQAAYNIQFGAIERATHENEPRDAAAFEVPGQKWADLSEQAAGVSLLTDSKYGYSVKGSTMKISLLRATTGPDPSADRHVHSFSYGLYCHEGRWQDSEINKLAYAFNFQPPVFQRDRVRNDISSLFEMTYADARTGDDTLILETLKRAEAGDGMVLRFYESKGSSGRAWLKFRWPGARFGSAELCDLLERRLSRLGTGPDLGTEIAYKPFEIITIKFKIV